MKYAISCRQPTTFLEQADIITVPWKDRKGLLDLGHKYPDKIFILFLDNDTEDAKELQKYNDFCHNNLICRVLNPKHLLLCQENDLKFYIGMPTSSFQQARAIKESGASFLYITAPLTHNLSAVKELGIPVAATLNSTNEFFPFVEDNVGAPWFRPEDEEYYSQYIDIGFLASEDLKQERAYFNVYNKLKFWDEDLNTLIIGLNYSAKNRMIPPTLAPIRGECGQKCMKNPDVCHICKTSLNLANPELFHQKMNVHIKGTE